MFYIILEEKSSKMIDVTRKVDSLFYIQLGNLDLCK